MNSPKLQHGAFLFLLAIVTLAFGWILLPFVGAVMWGLALAILFTPIYRRLLKKMRGRRNLAAITTLLMAMVVVIIPVAAITVSLINEVSLVSQMIRSGDISFASYSQQVINAAPDWILKLLKRFGLNNVEGLISQLSQAAAKGGQTIAAQAVAIGQNTFQFFVSLGIMLYLLFFLLRDGADLSRTFHQSLPLAKPHTDYLLNTFTTVIRATIKGNVAVAAVQGLIGGVTFSFMGLQGALLWGFLMAFLSLLPAVGAALIWGPVAIYFFAVGAMGKAIGLVVVGIFVIGLIDNILRPLLVGKDTRMPDYMVLLSTLGGIALFGINGFVIGPVIAALFMAAWSLFASSHPQDSDPTQ